MQDARHVKEHRRARAALAQNLATARIALALSQAVLARQAGLSRATVVELERGRGDPCLSTIAKLARALHVAPLVLLLDRDALDALAPLEAERAGPSCPVWLSAARAKDIDEYRASNLARLRARAVRIAAWHAKHAGMSLAAAVGAAIGALLVGSEAVDRVARLAASLAGSPEGAIPRHTAPPGAVDAADALIAEARALVARQRSPRSARRRERLDG